MFIDNLLDNLLSLVTIFITLLRYVLFGSILIYVVAMFQPLSFLFLGVTLMYLGCRK